MDKIRLFANHHTSSNYMFSSSNNAARSDEKFSLKQQKRKCTFVGRTANSQASLSHTFVEDHWTSRQADCGVSWAFSRDRRMSFSLGREPHFAPSLTLCLRCRANPGLPEEDENLGQKQAGLHQMCVHPPR